MQLPGVILIGAASVMLLGISRRILLWRRGKSSAWSFSDLALIPRRYLVDVHNVVVRDKAAARMHVVAAGSFVSTVMLATLVYIGGVNHPALLWFLFAGSVFLCLGGILVAARRLRPSPGRQLPSGSYRLIGPSLVGFGTFLGLPALLTLHGQEMDWLQPLPFLLAITGATTSLFLVAGLGFGPMRHAVAGALHLAFHPRPERFRKPVMATAPRPLNLSVEKLGIGSASDFTWNQHLSFDACVNCRRCDDVCPALAAGAPLSPRNLIQDLRTACQSSDFDKPLLNIQKSLSADTMWACTTCRACVEACPMLIEHVDVILGIRRHETLEHGKTPGKGYEVLTALKETDTVSGGPKAARDNWAATLSLPIAEPGKPVEVLLWLGDGAMHHRGQKTIASLAKVLRMAGVTFATVGDDEADTGDLARRLGDEVQFQRLARHNIEILNRYSFTTLVTTDPHVLQAIGIDYKEFGADYIVQHHSSYVKLLVDEGRLSITPGFPDKITYHDPCYLGRYNKEYDAPRQLLTQSGATLVEMEKNREKSFCCGWGGGAAFTDIPVKKRIPDLRAAQAEKTGACTIAVACPNCTVMLEGVSDLKAEVRDVIEIVAEAASPGPLTAQNTNEGIA